MNFNAVCRTCLSTDELNPIFLGSVDETRYSFAIFVTTGIKVAIDDGLPQQMCARCVSFSNASLKFRKQCKDAETRLLQVKQECDGAAETLNSGAVDSEDLNDKYMQLELKQEEDDKIENHDVFIKIEAGIQVEDSGSGARNTTEEDPLQLKPAGGAGAAPERARARPGEGPSCNTSHQQQLQLRSCFVRLERFPIEDLRRNLHTRECLMNFDCESSLTDHNCSKLQESYLNDVDDDETAKKKFKCDICAKLFVKKMHIIRHLAAHNVEQGGEKNMSYLDDDNFADTEDISYSDGLTVFETQIKNQSALTVHTGATPGPLAGEKKHSCNTSPKKLTSKSNLTKHIRNHTREKPFTCGVCKIQFTLSTSMVKHYRRLHPGEKPFACDICKNKFKTKRELTSHRRINIHFYKVCDENDTAIKCFECDICGKQYEQKKHIIRHLAAHNVKLSRENLSPYSSDEYNDAKVDTGEMSNSDNILHQIRNRSDLSTRTSGRPGAHICDICSKQFKCRRFLIRHVSLTHIHTEGNKFICDQCGKLFKKLSLLTAHSLGHTVQEKFTCDFCAKQYRRLNDLKYHRRIHTEDKSYLCGICNKKFSRKSILLRHVILHNMRLHNMRLHSEEKPYSCDYCKKQFKTSKNLACHHRRMHTAGTPYSCTVCSKRFSLRNYYISHMRSHKGEILYSCDTCKKGFVRKSVLINHLKIHTDKKSFTCDVCKKQFRRRNGLISHIQIHRKEKLYNCDVCKKGFGVKCHLTAHMKIHTGRNLFTCDVCGKQFVCESHLIIHRRVHTGERPFTCEVCGKKFVQSSGLYAHKKIHTGEKIFTCDVCKKQFMTSSHLRRHTQTMHDEVKPFICDVCGKQFGRYSHLTRHGLIHTRAKPTAGQKNVHVSQPGSSREQIHPQLSPGLDQIFS